MTLTRWPYPPMYQFLLDEFQGHLAKATAAQQFFDYEKYVVEMEAAQRALADFKILLAEFKSHR